MDDTPLDGGVMTRVRIATATLSSADELKECAETTGVAKALKKMASL